jgi:hypothetical protein
MAQRSKVDASWTSSAFVALAAISTATACGTNAEKSAATGADAAVGVGLDTGTSPLDAEASTFVDSSTDVRTPSSDADLDSAPAETTDPCHPFVMPNSDALFGSKRRVFAHYFYPFPLSIDNAPSARDYYNTQYLAIDGENDKWVAEGGYLRQRPLPVPVSTSATWQIENMEREVRLAIAAGITGFTVDVLGSDQTVAGSPLQNLLTAAAAVDTRFKIVVMPDLSALAEADAGAEESVVEAIVASVANSPSAYRLPAPDGRLVVSAFYAELQPVSWWQSVLTDLKTMGIDVAFVPVFLNLGANQAAFTPISYGLSLWGTATAQSAVGMQGLPAQAHAAGEMFMMPVDPQQYRPKDFTFWEAGNSAAFRDAWNSAIAGGSDWIQLVTWSDFSESGEVEPYTDTTLSGSIGTGYYDLNAYYASWFLMGTAPTITGDVLYYFYRREPTSAAATEQTMTTTASGGANPEDDIELLAFLVSPGTLTISINGQTFTEDAQAGITSFKTPLQPGTPTFSVTRGGATVVSLQGGIASVGATGLPSHALDLTYWSGSASKDGTCMITIP